MRPTLIACALVVASATAFAADPPKPAKGATPAAATQAQVDPALATAIAGDWRKADNRKRDMYRHPAETLTFFGLKADATVVEITPGGGWYTEILAPYLKADGKYVAAVVDPSKVGEGRAREYQQGAKSGFETLVASDARYAGATVVAYDPKAPVFGAPGSADLVLTFRNVHNWRMSGQAAGMFKGFFDVLKPGGTLGVVEHRAAKDVADDDRSGYVGEAQVIAMAEAAGFRLAGRSEVNANAKDTKDHKNGVWTLPPSNNHDEADRAKYQAIGESDRMTLRFVKD